MNQFNSHNELRLGRCCLCHKLDAVYLNQKAQGFCTSCFNKKYGGLR